MQAFTFPPAGFDCRVSSSVAPVAAASKIDGKIVIPAFKGLPAMPFGFPREEFQLLMERALGETDFKFMLMQVDLSAKTQNELRKMDPANQSVERQYRFLLERRSERRKKKD